jgi:Rod binding domain-containing protein
MLNGALKGAELLQKARPRLNELKKATQGVEAMFVKDLLAAMRRGMPKSGFGEKGLGTEIYKDMFDQALADSLGKTGALGIGKILYKQLANQAIRDSLGAHASRLHKIERATDMAAGTNQPAPSENQPAPSSTGPGPSLTGNRS